MQGPSGLQAPNSFTPPADAPLSAALAAQANRAVTSTASAPAFSGHSLGGGWQGYGPGSGNAPGGGQGGMIKWSSSILSKQRPNGSAVGEGAPGGVSQGLTSPPPPLGPGARSNSLVNMGPGVDLYSNDHSSSRTASGDGSKAMGAPPLDQLNGLMQLCRVTSPANAVVLQ